MLAGVGDEDGERALVVEIDVLQGCGFSAVPRGLGDGGSGAERHAFGRLAGADEGFAEQRGGGQLFSIAGKVTKRAGGYVLFLGGAGVELFAVSGGDEGGGEILEEEGEEVEAVLNAEGRRGRIGRPGRVRCRRAWSPI